MSALDFMYQMCDEDVALFGKHALLSAGALLKHGEWVTVARYAKEPGSDGLDAEVDCQAWPARFYRLRALDGVNSLNEPRKGFTLTTGSGHEMAALMDAVARAVREGMVENPAK